MKGKHFQSIQNLVEIRNLLEVLGVENIEGNIRGRDYFSG